MATKTFPYAVIWHGEIVPANTPIGVKEMVISKEESTTEKPRKKAVKKNDAGAVERS